MSDPLEKLGNSTIQHGPDNNRIYLMKLDPADLPGITAQLDALAAEKGYTKIFAKVPGHCMPAFTACGARGESLDFTTVNPTRCFSENSSTRPERSIRSAMK
jgi:hypothetical protein